MALLEIDDRKEEFSKNLVQIGTSEEKSLTLRITASILTLLGFDVYCACYSEYLSQRDYSASLSLFDLLGLLNYIHYSSFNKLFEENKGIEGNWCSRTVCLMDATSLMTNLLHKCKNTVNIMFECAFKVSKDNNINTDSFQIQFVEQQSSPWETKPDNLRAFMNTIEVERGWNN
ncbi:unnamed protein product [Rotaria sordida]|uniref:Uncharacterized protein n=1 Tax=Rotaria sordida TaxID=392033 RepID=A0A815AZH3_9BILA|nr:unnamed protein product [Rotaria sordida]